MYWIASLRVALEKCTLTESIEKQIRVRVGRFVPTETQRQLGISNQTKQLHSLAGGTMSPSPRHR